MQRIQLGKPYEEFVKKMIKSGYYSTSTEVIREALRGKMHEVETNRIELIQTLISESQSSLDSGNVVAVDENYLDELMSRAKENLKNNKEVPAHILLK